jgi:hypothetical protein
MVDDATKGKDRNDNGVGQKPAPFGKKHLLAIGISNYADATGVFKPLQYPAQDAKNLCRVLNDQYTFDTVRTMFDAECSESNIKEKVKAYLKDAEIKLTKDDGLVVLFSGHGAVEYDIPYWVAHDGGQVSISGLLDLLIACSKACRQVLLIVDCCFSGTAPEIAQLKTVFANLEKNESSLYIVTAGNKYEKVPDKSIFMEALLSLLSFKNFENFNELVGAVQKKLADKYSVTPFESQNKIAQPFILQRPDKAGYELKEAFYEFNYSNQVPNIKGVCLFNLLYLRGTRESGHHFFTQRYFKSNGLERLAEQSKDPVFITFGNHAQDPDYTIWKKLAPQIGLNVKDAAAFNENVLAQLKKNRSYVWIAKVDNNCDNETLEEALADFWKQMNGFFLNIGKAEKATLRQKIFFFIWDRRGDNDEEVNKNVWSEPYDDEFAKPLHPPPIEPVEKGPLVNWYNSINNNENDYSNLKQEQAFTRENILGANLPCTVDDAVYHLASVFNREEIYNSLINQEIIWPH